MSNVQPSNAFTRQGRHGKGNQHVRSRLTRPPNGRHTLRALQAQVRRLETQLKALRAKSVDMGGDSDFRQVIDASPVPLSVDDMQGGILYLNRKFQEKFGYSHDELPTSAAWFEKAYPNPVYRAMVARQWKALLARGIRSGKIGPLEVEVTCKDGTLRRMEFIGTIIRRRLLLAGNDVTERDRLEKEILQISEQEQERIGQDLHDGVCQFLSGIKFKTALLEQKLEAKGAPEALDARSLEAYINQAIEQVRNIARGLHPVELEARGLMSALQELAASTKKLFGVDCVCQFRSPVLVHDHLRATHLYRIAQEALNNAIHHGRASKIVIRLTCNQRGRMTMTIHDNGIGFSGKTRKRSGMGLHLMNYRARAIGGSIVIRRAPSGHGTVLACPMRVNHCDLPPKERSGVTSTPSHPGALPSAPEKAEYA
jgi:two-component system, LuxR family, sensor kinase FixL